MNEFLVTFRETLEAALIVGIVYTCLDKVGAENAKKYLWRGVAAAAAASVAIGFALEAVSESLKNEAYSALFEGAMMFAAGGCLIYMIVWMSRNTNIGKTLAKQTENALSAENAGRAVFAVVFFAIVREGFETAVFLFASDKMQGSIGYMGAVGGIAVAAGLGYLIFSQGKKIPLKTFFNVSSVLLIFMAAGMFAYGFHELEEFLADTGRIDEDAVGRAWDVLKPSETLPEGANPSFYTLNEENHKYYHFLHDKGTLGVYLKGFLGYNSDPNWAEVISWLGATAGGFYLWKKGVKPPAAKPV